MHLGGDLVCFFYLFSPQKTSWITEDDFSISSPIEEMGKGLCNSRSPSLDMLADDQPPIPSSPLVQSRLHASSLEAGKSKLSPEQESKGFSVVHRRQMGN